MDQHTTVAQLKDIVEEFCEERDWGQFHPTKDLAIGVVTEAGELLDHFRFKSDREISEMMEEPMRREEIADELSDVLYFVLRFAQMNRFDLSEEFLRKMEKNRQKYPLHESKGSNRKYDEA